MKSNQKTSLEDYSLPQLNILLKHIRLGFDHLKKMLTERQLRDLLKEIPLTTEQEKEISADHIETFGNMSLIINTILTSTFGAWMGLSNCIGSNIGSVGNLALITLFACGLSAIIGYMSLNTTKEKAYQAINQQHLYNFQLHILKLINQKVSLKNQEIAFYLNTAVYILEDHTHTYTVKVKENFNLLISSSEIYKWLDKLHEVTNFHIKEIHEPVASQLYEKNLNQVLYLIKKTLIKYVNFIDKLSLSHVKQKKLLALFPSFSFLKVLTMPSFELPSYSPMTQTLSKKTNYSELFLGLISTIWGGFASMFVFVGGIPNIAKELQMHELAQFLTQPTARAVEVGLALLISAYFAFAFFYTKRKSEDREHLLHKTEKLIANEETFLLQSNHTLNTFLKVKNQTQKLISILNILKKIDQST